MKRSAITSFDDDKADKLPASLELDDVKDGLAFLFDIPVLLMGDGHKHWRLSDSDLSKLSTRGKRAYKSIMKGKKSAIAKAAEQHLPIILFISLLLMILIPKIRESQMRLKADARLRQVSPGRGNPNSNRNAQQAPPTAGQELRRNVGATGPHVDNRAGAANGDGSGGPAEELYIETSGPIF